MTRENCEPWGYVAPVVAANVVAALLRRATHLLNFGIPRVHTEVLCIWFPWTLSVPTLQSVKTFWGGREKPNYGNK